MEKLLGDSIPKDLLNIIQEYAKDRTSYDNVMRELNYLISKYYGRDKFTQTYIHHCVFFNYLIKRHNNRLKLEAHQSFGKKKDLKKNLTS